jgi:glycerol-3-phosphate dehydrogenase (NAD(P)+)
MHAPTEHSRKISVLGAGAWGTAVAMALTARNDVLIWGRDSAAMDQMAAARDNTHYLPGFPLPASLRVSGDLAAAVAHAQGPGALVIAACPVAGLRPLLTQLQPFGIPNIVWLCKGFEGGTGLLPHQIVQQVLGDGVPGAALSGPSFAQEVARGLPCALTVASTSAALRELVVDSVHGGNIRVYACDDMVGVEVGGAVKNVLAIATGVADGMGLGLNARAALITRGLAEITRLGIALGGSAATFMGLTGMGDLILTCTGDLSRNRKVGLGLNARAALITRGLAEITRLGIALGGSAATFMGLTGMGDLILTCTGDLSRNRKVGLGLALGKPLEVIVAELGHVAEGVPCAKAVRALAASMGVEMPITNAVAGVLFDGDTPKAMLRQLLARDPRDELA